MDYKVNDIIEFEKNHPCSPNANKWRILEIDAGVRLKCMNCGHIIYMKRFDFDNKIVKVIKES